MKKFIFLKHTADIKFQAFGKTIEELFINSALATAKVLSKKRIKKRKILEINVKGNDLENLLYNFLEEFLFLIDNKNFILSEIREIKFNKKNLQIYAKIIGDNVGDYDLENDIKAITYHDMFVKKEKGVWISQVVLDI